MRRVNWAVLCSGFVAVIAQTLIIREALAIFGGNELVTGIILCFWLIWAGIGSLVFSGIRFRRDPLKIFSSLLLILCLLFAFSLCFIRIAPRVFALPFGEIIDLGKVILISVLTLAPSCVVFGMLFPAASRILSPERVYLLEGVGAFFGGVIVTFLLIQFLSPFGILLASVSLLVFVSLYITRRYWLLFLPLLVLTAFLRIDRVELFFRRIQMGGQNLLDLRETRYGTIVVTQSGSQYNFYTNGLYDFSYPDLFTSEEAVQYAMLLHPAPRNVLLVGGGIGNSISQVLKHPSVEAVTYVELDPVLFEMGEKYLGKNLQHINKLTVIFGDARYYVKNTTRQYDVIIVNLPDPVNVQINRFYTKEFFAEAKNILNPGGLFSARISAPPDIISPLFGQLLSTVRNTLKFSFDHVIALPTAKTTFIATDHEIPRGGIIDTLSSRINRRGLALSYVSPYYFDYNLSDEKVDYLNSRISEAEGYINRDVKPVCYYFASILWGGILSENSKRAFVGLFGLSPVFFLLPLVALFFFYRRKSLVYVSVLAVGASEISAEVILIVLFQVFYGYIYGWIGAIIACYMLGLAVGTFSYMKFSFFSRNAIGNLAGVEFILAAYFLIMIGVALAQPPFVNIIIPTLVFCGGLMGGLHFPLSIAIVSRERAGLVYGIDLIGSSIGALATAMILIPILGIVFTLVIFGLLNFFVGVGLGTLETGSKFVSVN
jgi:spermidine synthase